MSGGRFGMSWITLATQRLHEVIPRSKMKTFDSLDHFGIDKKDPRTVARAVGAFFNE